MSQPARRLHQDQPLQRPEVDTAWSGELHGQVGAMHRAIEERLFSPADGLAVVALPPRQGDALAAWVSRATGWAALGGGFAAALLLLR